jgi:phosphatidylglycerophosphatase A
MQPAGNQPKRTDPARQPSFIIKCIATVFFSGYAPIAPGTAGSLAALIPLIIFPTISTTVLLVIVVLGFIIGVLVSRQFERAYGEDPQVVVIDETVGMWITMLFVPITWKTLVLGFILFRIFDIIKPPPARQLEKVPNGWGIMLDDVAAGIYAGLLLLLITTFN